MGFDNGQLGTAVPTLRWLELGRLLEGSDDLGDFFSRHSEIRHRTEGVLTDGKQTDTQFVKPLGQGRSIAFASAYEQHVCFHALSIDPEPRQLGQAVGQGAAVCVVVGQAGAVVLKRMRRRRCEDADLPHRATLLLAEKPRLGNHVR